MSIIKATREAEAGGLQVQGQYGYIMRPCLQIK
jgi:hypothetical protein